MCDALDVWHTIMWCAVIWRETRCTCDVLAWAVASRILLAWCCGMRYDSSCHVMSCYVISCHVMSWHELLNCLCNQFIPLSVHLSVRVAVCLIIFLYVYLSIYPSIYLSNYLFIHVSICRSTSHSLQVTDHITRSTWRTLRAMQDKEREREREKEKEELKMFLTPSISFYAAISKWVKSNYFTASHWLSVCQSVSQSVSQCISQCISQSAYQRINSWDN